MRFQCPDKDDISEPRRGYKSRFVSQFREYFEDKDGEDSSTV